jgi:Hsp20/alpha crystallin family
MNCRFYFLLPTRSFFETMEATWKTVPPLLSPPAVVPPTSNNEKNGEKRGGDGEESPGISYVKGGVSGLIVQEFNAREARGSSSKKPGALEDAGQIVTPKLPQIVVSPRYPCNDSRKGGQRDSDRNDSLGIMSSEGGVTGGLIVKEFNAREAEGSSGVLSGTSKAGRQMSPPLPSSLKTKDERGLGKEEILGVGHDDGVASGLIVEELNASKAEGSSGILAGALEAAKQIGSSLLPPLVVVSLASSSDVRKDEGRECKREESLGNGHGEGDVSGLIVEELSAREAKWSDVPSGSLQAARKIAPENVKIDQLKTVMEDGVLTVTVPKGKVEKLGRPGVKSIEISE